MSRSVRIWSVGFIGASRGANNALNAKNRISPKPMMVSGLRKSVGRWRGRATVSGLEGASRSFKRSTILNARVEPVVTDVHGEIGEHINNGGEQCYAHDRRKIQIDSRSRRVAPQTGPGENRFRQHGAGEQTAKGNADDCHRRNERVAQTVPYDDRALAQSLGARGANVILIQH